ncbi:MAG: rod shape-determining protein [Clostridia bacterium]
MSNNIIIDLGGKFLRGLSLKNGYIVKDLNLVAVDNVSKQVKYSGALAQKMANNSLSSLSLITPIIDGIIVDNVSAKFMLQNFLAKLLNTTTFSRIVANCVAPCGLNSKDKSNIEGVLISLGVKQVKFLLAPLADAKYIFREFGINYGIICNIGQDIADISTVENDKLVNGCTLSYGGKNIDQKIVDFIVDKYSVKITLDEAEQFKCQCASLYPNDNSMLTVEGINILKGVSEQINLSSREMYNMLVDTMDKYIQVVNSLMATLPLAIATGIKREGLFLCGGLSSLTGIDKHFYQALNMNVRIPFSADDSVIRGAEMIIRGNR